MAPEGIAERGLELKIYIGGSDRWKYEWVPDECRHADADDDGYLTLEEALSAGIVTPKDPKNPRDKYVASPEDQFKRLRDTLEERELSFGIASLFSSVPHIVSAPAKNSPNKKTSSIHARGSLSSNRLASIRGHFKGINGLLRDLASPPPVSLKMDRPQWDSFKLYIYNELTGITGEIRRGQRDIPLDAAIAAFLWMRSGHLEDGVKEIDRLIGKVEKIRKGVERQADFSRRFVGVDSDHRFHTPLDATARDLGNLGRTLALVRKAIVTTDAEAQRSVGIELARVAEGYPGLAAFAKVIATYHQKGPLAGNEAFDRFFLDDLKRHAREDKKEELGKLRKKSEIDYRKALSWYDTEMALEQIITGLLNFEDKIRAR